MANTSQVTNVVSNEFFGRYNEVDLVYVQGLVNKHASKYGERLERAIEKALSNSPSLFDVGAYSKALEEIKALALSKGEVLEGPTRLKVVSENLAKQEGQVREATAAQVMNEQVVVNEMAKRQAEQLSKGPALTLSMESGQ